MTTKKKTIKAWAVALSIDNNFIPDFSVVNKMKNVMQIHSDKESAQAVVRNLGLDWIVLPVTITY